MVVDSDNDFWKAAREGDLELLKKASRKDTNKRDENGMTPVHWAAEYGKIEALRILVGKGGNPDKPNNEGSTSLHLAAGAGQLHCLVFLTNFGANVYAVNDQGEAPMQTATKKRQRECVRHLETLVAHQIMQDREKVNKTQQKARKEANKRIKEKTKLLQKLDRQYERKKSKEKKPSNKLKDLMPGENDDDDHLMDENHAHEEHEKHTSKDRSETSEYETMSSPDEEETASSTSSYREEIYRNRSIVSDDISFERGAFDDNSASGYTDTTTLTKSTKLTRLTHNSQSDRLAASLSSAKGDRPFIDNQNINMRLSESLPNMAASTKAKTKKESNKNLQVTFDDVTGSSNMRKKSKSSESLGKTSSKKSSSRQRKEKMEKLDKTMGTLFTFLSSLGLDEYKEIFIDEKIDLKACLLCDEYDLREIGLPLGPRKIIAEAIKKRSRSIEAGGGSTLIDTTV